MFSKTLSKSAPFFFLLFIRTNFFEDNLHAVHSSLFGLFYATRDLPKSSQNQGEQTAYLIFYKKFVIIIIEKREKEIP